MGNEKKYPPLNMYFTVSFHSKAYRDSEFLSVEGLQARRETTEPNGKPLTKFNNLLLRRAYEPDSKLVDWCMNALNNNKKEPLKITVKLNSPQQNYVSAWIVENAIPVGWGVEPLNAMESNVLIESIELSYDYFQVANGSGKIVAPIPKEE